MKIPADAHVAVLDGERFLLMRNRGSATAPKLVLEAEPDIAETNKDAGKRDHEGARRRAGAPHDRAAHAAGVADWLNRAVLQHRIEQLLVVADRDSLGELRRNMHVKTEAAVIGELDKLLTGIPGPDIVKVIEAA